MLTVENSGAVLVGGRPPHQGDAGMKTKKIKVIRPFYHDRKLCKKGDVIEVPAYWAGEYCACGKAEPVDEPAVVTGPETGTPKGKGKDKEPDK